MKLRGGSPRPSAWVQVEPGWWHLPDGTAVCKERDGKWHVYIDRSVPPGDSRHPTMHLAMRAAERKLRRVSP